MQIAHPVDRDAVQVGHRPRHRLDKLREYASIDFTGDATRGTPGSAELVVRFESAPVSERRGGGCQFGDACPVAAGDNI